jgi:hypothetical protein
MKQIFYILLIVLGFSTVSTAQNLEVSDSVVYVNLAPGEFLKTIDILVTNNSEGETVNMFWERVKNDLPAGYISYICDMNVCYGPDQSICPEDNPNIMTAGYSFDLKTYIERPVNAEGSGEIEMLVWEEGKKDQAIKIRYLINQATSTKSFDRSTVKVYPNPTEGLFRVDGVQDVRQVMIYNIVGEEIMTFNVTPERSYDISHLNSGIYLVKLIRDNGKTAKTIRLSKK